MLLFPGLEKWFKKDSYHISILSVTCSSHIIPLIWLEGKNARSWIFQNLNSDSLPHIRDFHPLLLHEESSTFTVQFIRIWRWRQMTSISIPTTTSSIYYIKGKRGEPHLVFLSANLLASVIVYHGLRFPLWSSEKRCPCHTLHAGLFNIAVWRLV